jgi:hypothetical protein
VGPIPVGINKFVFEADPPDLSRIPNSEIIGVTVILLSCSYEDREFVRVGYYVNNEYTDEALQLEPPAKPVIDKVRRHILAEKPRVTRFAIKWYVQTLLLREGDKLEFNTDIFSGIPRNQLPQSFRPTSLKQTSLPTATNMAPTKRKRRRKKSRPKAQLPPRKAKTLKWVAQKTQLAPPPPMTRKARRARKSTLRTAKEKTRRTRKARARRAQTRIWIWMRRSPVQVVLILNSSIRSSRSPQTTT